jgi:DNA-binding MarR family transcriptional regulator
MKTDKQLLTVREQEFLAFLKRYRGKLPSQIEIASDFGASKQRVYQLIGRLEEKGHCFQLPVYKRKKRP